MPGGQTGFVAGQAFVIGGDFDGVAGFGVKQAQVAGQRRVYLVGREEVDQADFEAAGDVKRLSYRPKLEQGAGSRGRGRSQT
ncbi:MAG: hypothetical protein HC875_12635, partial [Anaerolineales bacterium]|nr:hypothetical protein [Anaerolineales bacterium]